MLLRISGLFYSVILRISATNCVFLGISGLFYSVILGISATICVFLGISGLFYSVILGIKRDELHVPGYFGPVQQRDIEH
jgi:hypothetical protein